MNNIKKYRKYRILFFIISLIIICGGLSSCIRLGETEKKTESENKNEKPEVDSEVSAYEYAYAYAYEQLSEKEQSLYAKMRDALLNFELFIEGNYLEDYSFDELNKANKFVFLDYPEIFWASEGGTTYTSELNGVKTVTKYEFNYILNQSQKDKMQKQIDSAVSDFLNGLSSDLSEYGRTLAVYEYLIQTADYDTAAMNKISKGLKDDETARSQTIASVFIDKKTVCSGYSRATQYLLNKLGISCIYISGGAKGQPDSHAWNMVKIDGDYYLLDTTWGNPLSTDPTQEKRMTYNYFCLTAGEFNKSHTPNGDLILPDCTATKYNYFVYNNLLLNEYDPTRIGEILRIAINNGEKGVYIKFSSENAAENAIDSLFAGNSEIFDILGKISAGTQSVAYSFDSDVSVLYIGLQ